MSFGELNQAFGGDHRKRLINVFDNNVAEMNLMLKVMEDANSILDHQPIDII